jgi:hypothetical protein
MSQGDRYVTNLSPKTVELAQKLEELKERFPEVFRHIVGLIQNLLK